MKLSRNNRQSGGHEGLSMVFWVVSAVLFALLLRFFILPMHTIGYSMEPSIHNGQYELVDTWTYRFSHPPQRGDIIVTVAPFDSKLLLVKRIIGTPQDTVTIRDSQVVVNGVTLDERYVSPTLQGNPYVNKYWHFTVPKDEYWVMGDNRAHSGDSREFGFVPRKNIIGRVTVLLGPFAPNSGYVPDETDVFKGV